MIELVKKSNYDFMSMKRFAFALSAVLVLLGIIGTVQIFLGHANLGVELSGGTSIQLKFQEPFSMDQVRSILSNAGYDGAQLQGVEGENILLIKLRLMESAGESTVAESVLKLFGEHMPDNKFTVESVSEVGPAIGHKLRQDATWALAISALAIIIYLGWRFEFKFGVIAVITIFHDLLAMVGIFWVSGLEQDLLFITALLTIGGYSLTDKVVVFDRTRENIRLRKKPSFSETINLSLNEVLSRTLMTSLTTLLGVIALLCFGGDVLRNFAIALSIGIVMGNYSSIFLAGPVLVLWRGEKMTEV
ncbi:MAG: protein translocase subunit SecF [Syntrophorhabdaceae bacterium]|nr:protein translocase subunit SecF [Syntrophorhabdaceae bacterium]